MSTKSANALPYRWLVTCLKTFYLTLTTVIYAIWEFSTKHSHNSRQYSDLNPPPQSSQPPLLWSTVWGFLPSNNLMTHIKSISYCAYNQFQHYEILHSARSAFMLRLYIRTKSEFCSVGHSDGKCLPSGTSWVFK